MGYKLVRKVFEESRAKGNALLVLVNLAERANADGECWPSVETIAQETKLKERAVQNALAGLQALGELRVTLQDAPLNRRRQYKTNLYTLFPGVHDDAPPGVHENASRGARKRLPGVHAGAPRTKSFNRKEPPEDERVEAFVDAYVEHTKTGVKNPAAHRAWVADKWGSWAQECYRRYPDYRATELVDKAIALGSPPGSEQLRVVR